MRWPDRRRHDDRLERAILTGAKEIAQALDRSATRSVQAIDQLTAAVKSLPISPPTNSATGNRLIVSIGGDSVDPVITVDTTDGTVTLAFTDDKGDPTAAPAGVTVTYSIDGTSVCTVAADATNPLEGDLTPVAIGSFNLSASVTGTYANGNPIGNPAPYAGTIVAGAAAEDDLVIAASN